MSRITDIDAYIDPKESKRLVEVGRQKERDRILTIIELDLLTSQEVKDRLRDLVNGGKEDVESRSSKNISGT